MTSSLRLGSKPRAGGLAPFCNVVCEFEAVLQRHLASKGHIEKAAGLTPAQSRRREQYRAYTSRAKASGNWYCPVCNIVCHGAAAPKTHKKTKRHRQKAEKAGTATTQAAAEDEWVDETDFE
jgi:hypothetical protein